MPSLSAKTLRHIEVVARLLHVQYTVILENWCQIFTVLL